MDISNLKYFAVMNMDNEIVGKRKVYSVSYVPAHGVCGDHYLINSKIFLGKGDVEKAILLNDRTDLPVLEDVINNPVEIKEFEYYPVFDYHTKTVVGKRKVKDIIFVQNAHCYLVNGSIIISIPAMERDYSALPEIEQELE